jgi:hypothetical protein
MWLFTPDGLVSIVAHRDEPGCLLVRARARAHLVSFLRGLPAKQRATIRRTPDADYPYRATVPRKAAADVVAKLVLALDYPNFKGEAYRRGAMAPDVLHDVWEDASRLEDAGARRDTAPPPASSISSR